MSYELIHSGGSHGGGGGRRRGYSSSSHKYISREWKNGRWQYRYENAKRQLQKIHNPASTLNSRNIPNVPTSAASAGAKAGTNPINRATSSLGSAAAAGAKAGMKPFNSLKKTGFTSINKGLYNGSQAVINAMKSKPVSEVKNDLTVHMNQLYSDPKNDSYSSWKNNSISKTLSEQVKEILSKNGKSLNSLTRNLLDRRISNVAVKNKNTKNNTNKREEK